MSATDKFDLVIANSVDTAVFKISGSPIVPVSGNAPITGATKTKITYDSKGFVIVGADATQDDIGDGTTNKQYSATDKTKLAGIASGATANSSDATLLNRANHTGTQLAATISDFNSVAGGIADAKVANDLTASTTVAPSKSAVNTGLGSKIDSSYLDTDVSLSANSDSKIASQKATKTYADTKLASGANAVSATILATTRNIQGVSFNGSADIEIMSTATQAGADKATPVDADNFSIFDSVASFVLKKVTWANIKATLKTYFDSVTTTLTNKRITKRTATITSSATPTINTDNVDYFSITALATAITSMTSGLTGTPTDAQTLNLSILDNGAARAITWGSSFESSGNVTLPTTTIISTRMDLMFVWNTVTSKFRIVGLA